jgi:osmoprotectant transport system ATP-binding protein
MRKERRLMRAYNGRWILVTDGGRVLGWFDTESHSATVTEDALNRAATFSPQSGNIRQLLDSALSAPSKRAIVVNVEKKLVGSATIDHIVDLLKQTAR